MSTHTYNPPNYFELLAETMQDDDLGIASCRSCGSPRFGYRVWPSSGDAKQIEVALEGLRHHGERERLGLAAIYLFACSPTRPVSDGFYRDVPCEAWNALTGDLVRSGPFDECVTALIDDQTDACPCDRCPVCGHVTATSP